MTRLPWPLLRPFTGGVLGGALLVVLQVPAGALLGAVLGSALANRVGAWSPVVMPAAGVSTGLVLLGGVAGARLDAESLATLGQVALPLTGAVMALVMANVGLAAVLVRRYGIDRTTAVLACAPGGVSEVAVVAQALGARTEVVFAIHAVRVLAVVLLVLPLLVVVLDVQ